MRCNIQWENNKVFSVFVLLPRPNLFSQFISYALYGYRFLILSYIYIMW